MFNFRYEICLPVGSSPEGSELRFNALVEEPTVGDLSFSVSWLLFFSASAAKLPEMCKRKSAEAAVLHNFPQKNRSNLQDEGASGLTFLFVFVHQCEEPLISMKAQILLLEEQRKEVSSFQNSSSSSSSSHSQLHPLVFLSFSSSIRSGQRSTDLWCSTTSRR